MCVQTDFHDYNLPFAFADLDEAEEYERLWLHFPCFWPGHFFLGGIFNYVLGFWF